MKPSTFEKNAERMGYPEFRRQHLFIGTGYWNRRHRCKTVIRSRAKQSGMFRTVRGPNAKSGPPLLPIHGRFEDYW